MTSKKHLVMRCIVFSAIVGLAIVNLAVHALWQRNAHPTLSVHGVNHTAYRVFYYDNDLFENPIAPELQLLLAYVAHIEIDNGLSVQLNDEADIDYTFVATERLVIHHGTDISPTMANVVFTSENTVSHSHGSAQGDALRVPQEQYTFYLSEYIEAYRLFVEEYNAQEASRGFTPAHMKGFSAELHVDFTYTLTSGGLQETVTTGYRIPLSSGVFSVVATGNGVVQSNPNPYTMGVFPIITSVLLFGLGSFGLMHTLRFWALDKDPARRQVMGIVKKYANGIIESMNPVQKEGLILVDGFDDLLKLSIIHSGHIDFYRNTNVAEFSVLVGDHLYYYAVNLNTQNG